MGFTKSLHLIDYFSAVIKNCQITVFGKIPMTFFVNSIGGGKNFNAGVAKTQRRKVKSNDKLKNKKLIKSLIFPLRLRAFATPALNTLILIAVSHLGGKCADAVFV